MVPLLNKNVNSLQPTYFNNINPVILKSSLDINWSSTKVSLPGEKVVQSGELLKPL